MARRSRTLPLRISFVTPCRVCCPCLQVPQPRNGNPSRVLHRSGLGSSRFARRYSGSHCCFLFLGVLRCFNSPGSLHWPYFVQARVTPHDGCRVSPFGHPRIEARSAAPRGFSQPPTSFIGIRRQGIHRWLFVAWEKKDARARYASFKERSPTKRRTRRLRGRTTGPPKRAWGYSLKTEQRRARQRPPSTRRTDPTTGVAMKAAE